MTTYSNTCSNTCSNINSNLFRTKEDILCTLKEYKQEADTYSETAYNQVVALEHNHSITAYLSKEGSYLIDFRIHPSRYNTTRAQEVCSLVNERLGVYSRCKVIPYHKWLTERIKQLEKDIIRIK